MKYFYYVICQKENIGEINIPIKVSESNNLYSVFKGLKNIIYIHQCKNQKSAIEIANTWNKCAFNQGKYAYNCLYPTSVIKY